MRTLFVAAASSLAALIVFAPGSQADSTIDLLWNGTTATLSTGAISTELVLHVVITAGSEPTIGGQVSVDYSSAADGVLAVVSAESGAMPPLPVKLLDPIDTGTQVLRIFAASLGGPGLLPGQSFLLGTIVFHKGPGVGTFELQSFATRDGGVADTMGGLETEVTFNSATLISPPEPGEPVDIDIKPGNEANRINPMSRGVIKVAILGSASFDVLDVDVESLAFGPAGAAPAHHLIRPERATISRRHSKRTPKGTDDTPRMRRASSGHPQKVLRGSMRGSRVTDVNDDGIEDLVSYYRTLETEIAFGDTQARLTGVTRDGTPFEGTDEIRTVPACGIGFELAVLLPPIMWVYGRRKRSIG